MPSISEGKRREGSGELVLQWAHNFEYVQDPMRDTARLTHLCPLKWGKPKPLGSPEFGKGKPKAQIEERPLDLQRWSL